MIKINNFKAPNSASPTIIGTGTFYGKPSYFKIVYAGVDPSKSTLNTQAVLYEADIYKYIAGHNEEIKKYFVNIFNVFEVRFDFLVTNIIENQYDPIFLQRKHDLHLDDGDNVCIIITENSESITLNDFIKLFTDIQVSYNYDLLKRTLSNIFYLVLQGINILNNTLRIQHNDMHFGNILIKENIDNIFYDINKTDIEHKMFQSKYKISIYDFDRAYLEGTHNNLLDTLCPNGTGCNSLSNKDVFVFIQSVMYNYITYELNIEYVLLVKYLKELLLFLLNNDVNIFNILEQNLKNINSNIDSTFWSAYCIHIDAGQIIFGKPCLPPTETDTYLPWLNIDNIISNFGNFTRDIQKKTEYYYYKKYLKYKQKYLKLQDQLGE